MQNKRTVSLVIMINAIFSLSYCSLSQRVNADNVVDQINITVPISCTLSSTGSGVYSATISPGDNAELIGNPISIKCNDTSGYDLYAVGYSGDSYEINNTDLQFISNSNYNIKTADTSEVSYWAMKTVADGIHTPIIDNSFDQYRSVPSSYTRIAHYDGLSTDSIITPSYYIKVSSRQIAGTYEGKVKYTVVHPKGAEPPSSTVMQNIDTSKCTSSPLKVVDIRDGEEYHIQRLNDGNCWMLENLALDLTDLSVLTNLTENTTNASNLSLEYLKGERTGTINDQYATTAVSSVWNNKNNQSSTSTFSFSDPRIYAVDSKKTDSESGWSYGVYYNYCAASAGSYCYGDGGYEKNSFADADEDICPSGWRLPTGGANGEYYNIVSSDNNIRDSLQLPLSGTVVNGVPTSQGDNGSWWSSSRNNDSKMNRFYIGTWEIYPDSTDNRSTGATIRCVLGS